MRRRCELLEVNRSTLYYTPQPIDVDDITMLNEIRDIWWRYPFYGYRRITKELQCVNQYNVNHKRVLRLMRQGSISALYPGPNTSRRNKLHKVHPYLLKHLSITRPNQVWMTDISYLRLASGFVYLIAFIDVYSRYVVGWRISTTLETSHCLTALELALTVAMPSIINTDQGAQFTDDDWVKLIESKNIKVSMTGKGRCLDNVYIERFWRSVKQEEFYLNEYSSIKELRTAIGGYIEFYNHKRWHQSLNYQTPASLYFHLLNKDVVNL